jgi:hypothetical protein
VFERRKKKEEKRKKEKEMEGNGRGREEEKKRRVGVCHNVLFIKKSCTRYGDKANQKSHNYNVFRED